MNPVFASSLFGPICVTEFKHFQVFIHNPHQRLSNAAAAGRMEATQKSQEIAMLNINQKVTALAAGKLDPRFVLNTMGYWRGICKH